MYGSARRQSTTSNEPGANGRCSEAATIRSGARGPKSDLPSTTLLKEEKLVYFLHMLGPLALLPARRWALLFLAVPGFAFSLLTTGYAPTLSIAFQYTCHAIPYIFAASVLMLRVIARGAVFELTGRQPRGEVFQLRGSLARRLAAAGMAVVSMDESDSAAPIVVALQSLARIAALR